MDKNTALSLASKYGLVAEVLESYKYCDSWEEALSEWDIL